ncbi:MAG: LCP family protein [Anaerostipes sp.]|nr:LCP family protein [Anaerostipes sp.]
MKARTYKIILAVFVIVAVSCGSVLGYYDARLEASVNTQKKLTKTSGKKVSGIINILLVGSDHGAIKGDSGRSDSCMIATINTKTKELKLTSLMRDVYVDIPGHDRNKMNAAYAYGGVDLLSQTIAKNYGISVDHYAVVDFETFEKVIDKIGGVDISLEAKEVTYLNSTNYISKKKYRNVKEGMQTLNGNQALGYSRVRYVVSQKYGDGDFGRTGRQRAVLEAAYKKLLSKSPTTIASIALDSLKDVSTDMTSDYIKKLATTVISMCTTKVDQLQVPMEGTYTMGRAQSNMFVFFANFDANKAALNYFIFGKGQKMDWAKKYGGTTNVETFGYNSYTDGDSSSSDGTSSTSSSRSSTSSSSSSGGSSSGGSSSGSSSGSSGGSSSSGSSSGSSGHSTSSTSSTHKPAATTSAPATSAPATTAAQNDGE